ncbi:DUF3658 domain-containing protein [Flammeovirga kamogawensis]|uniref:DUF1835 domain-containing protein n=1 Tax=Flammeovirga kamogawensis TaxID=373891 RepID=A0ABX8GYK6_9BACT|nr:DUF3658 domain-containing protein [Flammeovirga kamogawensis]MBB6459126.1 hypothetical protein [Flammeovirga kamogawensis]QWG08695.1 DUF1835 domain-containing protein [Flammeovirga kamogawensis]TRX66988.1 DUF1835 domain-containing protein [Flammeovirga kamogawensis]
MYHICLSDPERGALKYFFLQQGISDHKIICLHNELTVGPLSPDLNSLFTENRTTFYKEYLEFDDPTRDFYISKFVHPNYFSDLNEYSSIVVWKGENVAEELLLRFVANFSRFKDIYVAEVATIDAEYKNVAEVNPILFPQIWGKWKLISEGKRKSLINNWNKLGKQPLRILENGEIIEVPITFYDDHLLSFVTTSFQPSGRVVGQTLSSIDQRISDTFIYFRLRNLIKAQKVAYEGNLFSMMDLKVKLP